jgi:hypothetical protein
MRHPGEMAQINSIWGNIYATPPGDYNSFKSHSLYIKNIEGDVSQGVGFGLEIVAIEGGFPDGGKKLQTATAAEPGPCLLENASDRWIGGPLVHIQKSLPLTDW